MEERLVAEESPELWLAEALLALLALLEAGSGLEELVCGAFSLEGAGLEVATDELTGATVEEGVRVTKEVMSTNSVVAPPSLFDASCDESDGLAEDADELDSGWGDCESWLCGAECIGKVSIGASWTVAVLPCCC